MNNVTVDFSAEISRKFSFAQLVMDARSAVRSSSSLEMSTPERAIVKSSANETVSSETRGKSLTKKLKRHGLRTEPCGTPVLTHRKEDWTSR